MALPPAHQGIISPMTEPDQTHLPGAFWKDGQVHFVLRSAEAEGVEVCLFDSPDSPHESTTLSLQPRTHGIWEAVVPDLRPGQLYGYRVLGPWNPSQGLRFNPTKVLIDPLAAAISGSLIWNEALSQLDPAMGEGIPGTGDTAPFVPKSVVVDPAFDWQGDEHPAIPWSATLIYECHVRGMTRLHPQVPPESRGKYLGLCHEAIIEHLQGLGVTAVELLPVQHFIPEPHLHRLGLTNYFGYNPIGWIAPHAAYATGEQGEQVREFKTMVRTLHKAGLEVLLDVVFNHTAEGNEHGPTLSHRGLDNRVFYRLRSSDPSHYENFSGCGNTVHFGHPNVVDLVLACLRYWVTEMHVDGFRFDLAPVLGREVGPFDATASFFKRLRRDPVLSQVKLIAEPWDVGPEGYQLGRFPAPWREWNDRFRDATRAFWRGDKGLVGEMIQRLAGSHDLLTRPTSDGPSSIDFVTSHDGFTLQDLVSYEHRHNWDNGEENRDGHQNNLSCNWGVEGPTQSRETTRIRTQVMRNFVATLALSSGVPMMSHGDEVARTQRGNNNAYCQDNELTWVSWELQPDQREWLEFTRQVFGLRRDLDLGGAQVGTWLSAHAGELNAVQRARLRNLPFGWLRQHDGCQTLTIFNADAHGHLFELPHLQPGGSWRLLINTARPGQRTLRGRAVRVPPRSLMLLRTEARSDWSPSSTAGATATSTIPSSSVQ